MLAPLPDRDPEVHDARWADLFRLELSLENHVADGAKLGHIQIDCCVPANAYSRSEMPVRAFKSRRRIHAIAVGSVLKSSFATNIANHGNAGVNAYSGSTKPMLQWLFSLSVRFAKYVESRKDGELFDTMKMQLEAIASMSGMEDVFKLNASEVFEILKVEEVLIS